MVAINSKYVSIGERNFNKDKSGYPLVPTVFSGVDVTWGSNSCIEHPEPSRALLSLWVPKTHEDWIPELGEIVGVAAAMVAGGDLVSPSNLTIFSGKIESVKVSDDHETAPAPLYAGFRNMVNLTNWAVAWSLSSGGTYTDITSQTTITDGQTLNIPFLNATTTTHYFKVTTPKIPVTPDKVHAISWDSNKMSGVLTQGVGVNDLTIVFRYYNSSNTLISTSSSVVGLSHQTFTPPTGTATVTMEFVESAIGGPSSSPFTLGSFILVSDVAPKAGYVVNVVAADALAEAARLRLYDTPWPFEAALNRQARIGNLATKSGVNFATSFPPSQGYFESLNTTVIPRDVDSYPALEAYQRTTMAAGHTVLSAANKVQPSEILLLPQVIGSYQPPSGVVYSARTTTAPYMVHDMTTNGILTRTNHAMYASTDGPNGDYSDVFYRLPGTGGVCATSTFVGGSARRGNSYTRITWTTGATGGTQNVSYRQGGISGASGSAVSGGMWIKSSVSRAVKIQVNLYSGTIGAPVAAGTLTAAANTNLVADQWTWLSLNNAVATTAYTIAEVAIVPQTNMLTGEYFNIDGVLIEKGATAGTYFDCFSLASTADLVPEERANLAVVDASAIEDDVFEIDTSKVINEIKVEMKRVYSLDGVTQVVDNDQTYRDDSAAMKTTPQTRSIATDWAVGSLIPDDTGTSIMAAKGKLLLIGQKTPTWRLSNSMTLVLDNVVTQTVLQDLLKEATRFGKLLKITNAPSFVSPYVRIRGGRIVLGDNPTVEFDLEPVEYSAPLPLSGISLRGDYAASNYTFANAKTLTFNDLRTIGAR